jgi:hypothetical protein
MVPPDSQVYRHLQGVWLDRVLGCLRSHEVYESALRVHILPAFEGSTVLWITQEQVRQWHGRLVKSQPGMAPKCYRILRAILGTAVGDGLLGENPCRIRGASQDRPEERRILQ